MAATLLVSACAVTSQDTGFADEEAPIRVRNGSLDFEIMDASQAWERIGKSRNWRIKDKSLPTPTLDIRVVPRTGATCGSPVTATTSLVRLTYHTDGQSPGDAGRDDVIELDARGHFTMVRPGPRVTLEVSATNPHVLTYKASGFLKQIEVGGGHGPLCSFAAANQLDHIESKKH